jgi:transposase
LNELPAATLVYIDECGIDQYLYREYAYSLRGKKVIAKISGKKFKRTNIVAGICCGRWIAPLTYSGTTDSILFAYWFEQCLLKEAKLGSTFILDNATFHRKSVLPALAERYGCRVLFLPPYSPELNPIENKWAWLKKKLRKILPDFDSFEAALLTCF